MGASMSLKKKGTQEPENATSLLTPDKELPATSSDIPINGQSEKSSQITEGEVLRKKEVEETGPIIDENSEPAVAVTSSENPVSGGPSISPFQSSEDDVISSKNGTKENATSKGTMGNGKTEDLSGNPEEEEENPVSGGTPISPLQSSEDDVVSSKNGTKENATSKGTMGNGKTEDLSGNPEEEEEENPVKSEGGTERTEEFSQNFVGVELKKNEHGEVGGTELAEKLGCDEEEDTLGDPVDSSSGEEDEQRDSEPEVKQSENVVDSDEEEEDSHPGWSVGLSEKETTTSQQTSFSKIVDISSE
jgi:hypothetical protein